MICRPSSLSTWFFIFFRCFYFLCCQICTRSVDPCGAARHSHRFVTIICTLIGNSVRIERNYWGAVIHNISDAIQYHTVHSRILLNSIAGKVESSARSKRDELYLVCCCRRKYRCTHNVAERKNKVYRVQQLQTSPHAGELKIHILLIYCLWCVELENYCIQSMLFAYLGDSNDTHSCK